MKTLAAIIAVSATMLTTSAPANASSLTPDLVIINASVHTMDEAHPTAEAVAIVGTRIAAIGSTADIRSLAGKGTRVVEARENQFPRGIDDTRPFPCQ